MGKHLCCNTDIFLCYRRVSFLLFMHNNVIKPCDVTSGKDLLKIIDTSQRRSHFDWRHIDAVPHPTSDNEICRIIISKKSHPPPQDFHADLWGNSKGSSLRKFPHDFSAEIQGKWRGIFFVDISASFPCGIPGDISTWNIPSCFPRKFQNAI